MEEKNNKLKNVLYLLNENRLFSYYGVTTNESTALYTLKDIAKAIKEEKPFLSITNSEKKEIRVSLNIKEEKSEKIHSIFTVISNPNRLEKFVNSIFRIAISVNEEQSIDEEVE